ncbi:MAG: M14 family zinc carboxypeptidase [Bacteroidota bacterium]|jgi:hypothetical protein
MKKIFLFFIVTSSFAAAQFIERDPCGYPDTTTRLYKELAGTHWGYGFDSLLADIQQWKKSPFVKVDSVGVTVQNRPMFLLTIEDTLATFYPRHRIWIHARTHPGEVQGTWVTNEIIKILLTDTLIGKTLRDSCVFNIMPMYNPDGVELEKPRENANGIDIESNWSVDTSLSQPEVKVLRKTFTRLMAESNPVQIALNMHSAYGKERYFVYHTANGTSDLFSNMEITFIDTVRYHFPGGIKPHTFFVSWTSTAATQYPESWFWYNHRENVLALTYEDMNDPGAHAFDTTARAVLNGIADYLGITDFAVSVPRIEMYPSEFVLEQNYPNPFNPSTVINYRLPTNGFVTLKVYDVIGKEVATLVNTEQTTGNYSVTFDGSGLSSGLYFARLQNGSRFLLKKMVLMK